jgi:transcriptional regulator with XRE-family HTH domain
MTTKRYERYAVDLTQPEIIQILRRRVDMNQGTFGAKAFNTSFESGRTKIKNIELGKQAPTEDDMVKMARVLGVSVEVLKPEEKASNSARRRYARVSEGILISKKTLGLVPGLGAYMDMLNKAVMLEDKELIQHLAEKLSDIFSQILLRDTEKKLIQQNA